MASNCTASSDDVSKHKPKRKRLTVAEKMEVLNMMKEGKSQIVIARHFGVHPKTIYDIKKAGERIRTMADITFNMSAKRIFSDQNKPLILMEAALIEWIVECSTKNIVLNEKTIRAKALSLYKRCADMATEDTPCRDEDNIEDQRPRNSSC